MKTDEFRELAGRIDAVYLAFGSLFSELEIRGVIDGPRLADRIRLSAADRLRGADDPAIQASAKALAEIADGLDEARRNARR